MKAQLLGFMLIGTMLSTYGQKKDYNIVAYGAKPGLSINNKKAIQAAIDAAAKTGGRVIVPAGNFATAPIQMKSSVELYLAPDAILYGSTNRLDYNEGEMSVIWAEGQHNIAITGKGTINGQGRDVVEHALELLRAGKITDEQYLAKRPNEANRPNLIYFKNCERINITGITLRNAASWVQNYKQCKDLVIDSITVHSNEYWNNDGLDIVDSKNVKITNSYFNAADDAICLKSEVKGETCENIWIENCIARSSANAFKIGTGSLGNFKNITVKNLTVFDTYRSAIAIETVDGGSLEDVHISHVVGRNTGNAIFIRLGHRNPDERYSSLSNITIDDVKVEVPSGKPDIGYPVEGPLPKVPPHNLLPASIVGLPGHVVQNVSISNVEISYGGGAKKEIAYVSTGSLATVTENAAGYPEFSMFGELPSWALYVRHAGNIKISNFKVLLQQSDFRPAMVFDDVTGLSLKNINLPASVSLPAIVYKNVNQLESATITLPPGDEAILKLDQ
ncbi:glycoside hydrolase family 28 protein [Mucilaginibacter paludis]|uniref:Glycoside hydrolase family 28 n=1 Tax=Mucilaginibacter paludis DSM 18603 TaxID=714943 RepID=H1YA32_9SPHI|nr:glycosyl hydrolase family 28 protein [Mucilaginibacter paludis]EHQ25016.1 glycoside hydrolase family 28 [Mucilaginibacter paludis DSM 18603]